MPSSTTGVLEKTTFRDVAGPSGAESELEEIIVFLRNPVRVYRVGGEMPKGVLLMGPPGTGKTLLARAVAGEAQVPFYSMGGKEVMFHDNRESGSRGERPPPRRDPKEPPVRDPDPVPEPPVKDPPCDPSPRREPPKRDPDESHQGYRKRGRTGHVAESQ